MWNLHESPTDVEQDIPQARTKQMQAPTMWNLHENPADVEQAIPQARTQAGGPRPR